MTDVSDPAVDYNNLTFDPASADHIINNTCGVYDIKDCGPIWINQAGIGHKITKVGRHWYYGTVYLCSQLDASVISQPFVVINNSS